MWLREAKRAFLFAAREVQAASFVQGHGRAFMLEALLESAIINATETDISSITQASLLLKTCVLLYCTLEAFAYHSTIAHKAHSEPLFQTALYTESASN